MSTIDKQSIQISIFLIFVSVGTSNEQVSGRKRKFTSTTTQAKRARVNGGECENCALIYDCETDY